MKQNVNGANQTHLFVFTDKFFVVIKEQEKNVAQKMI
jgi:hypothetical protein